MADLKNAERVWKHQFSAYMALKVIGAPNPESALDFAYSMVDAAYESRSDDDPIEVAQDEIEARC